QARQMQFQHADGGSLGADQEAAQAQALAAALQSGMPKVGRNDPCPCGSGKKYKHCHGQLA
ncbi:MAG: SEC-C metal-binding domain-containing protein, partial [Luteimonas sp.]